MTTYLSGWIRKHRGISRRTLEIYEKKGYIHPRTDSEVNKTRDKKYKEYSEQDVETAWQIKTLIDIGYTHCDIASMMENNEYVNIRESIEGKIKELQEKRERLDFLMRYAETIRQLGVVPAYPKEQEEVLFEDYAEGMRQAFTDPCPEDVLLEEAIQHSAEASANSGMSEEGAQAEYLVNMYETISRKPIREWTYEDVTAQSAATIFNAQLQYSCVLLSRLADRPINDETVQTIVQYLYDVTKNIHMEGKPDPMTPGWFGQHIPAFVYGSEMSLEMEQMIGKEKCRFIAEAISWFGERRKCEAVQQGEPV